MPIIGFIELESYNSLLKKAPLNFKRLNKIDSLKKVTGILNLY